MILNEYELENFKFLLKKMAEKLNNIGYNQYNPLFNKIYDRIISAQNSHKLKWVEVVLFF